jgi:hypothetical protein
MLDRISLRWLDLWELERIVAVLAQNGDELES